MKTLYIHVGTPKTGTTAIQDFCMKNRKLLREKGYFYPLFPYKYEGKNSNRNGLFLTAFCREAENDSQELAEEKRRFDEGMERIRTLFEKFDNIILSDEGIWRAVKIRRPTLWQELADAANQGGYTVKIIVYLRKQDDFIASLWNQRIKNNPVTMTWEEFIEERNRYANLSYYKTLKRAAKSLGKENLIVRRYDRSFLKGGMTQTDFLDAIGLELTDEYDISQPVLNSSLSLNACEIKRVINGMEDISRLESLFFQDSLVNMTKESSQEYPCTIWDAEKKKEFTDFYESANRKIADQFIGDGLPLFQERPLQNETWRRDNPHMENDIIRFSTSCDLSLLREIETLKEQLATMQKEVDMLRQFRTKIKHPFKTAVRKILNKFKRSR